MDYRHVTCTQERGDACNVTNGRAMVMLHAHRKVEMHAMRGMTIVVMLHADRKIHRYGHAACTQEDGDACNMTNGRAMVMSHAARRSLCPSFEQLEEDAHSFMYLEVKVDVGKDDGLQCRVQISTRDVAGVVVDAGTLRMRANT
eukprot:1161480-Pelagomonas_calceolata.AAC.2